MGKLLAQVILQGWCLEMSNGLRKPHMLARGAQIANEEGGWFLVSAIIMTLFLTAIGLTISAQVALQYQHTKREAYVQNAELVAEAGIEQAVNQLNSNDSFTGYASPQVFFDNTT